MEHRSQIQKRIYLCSCDLDLCYCHRNRARSKLFSMETRSRIFKPMENRLNGAQDLIYDTLGPVLRPRIRLLRQMNYIRLHLQCKSPARRGICFTRLSGAADTKCQRDGKKRYYPTFAYYTSPSNLVGRKKNPC